jgi:hypothetical protein
MANLEYAGFVYDDAGDAINGATVNLYDRNDTDTVRATTTTNSSGYWTISHGTEGRFDVEIVSGSSKRRRMYDDAIQYTEVEVANLLVRNPANTYKYDIVPAAITADRALTLPLITGSDTLVSEGVSRTFTADMTFNDNVNLTLGTGGDVDIDYDGTDLIINARVVGTGNVDFRQHLTWGAGVAITAGDYAIGRDADGTNQLHLNVPNGASFELSINDTAEIVVNATNMQPGADDGLALGVSGTAFADLFLASGAVVNFNAGDVTLTHSANTLTLGGGVLALGSNSITAGSILANSNDVGAIGASGTAWSDLFLASGAVINFNAGDVTLTHTANTLTVAGGSLTLGANSLTAGSTSVSDLKVTGTLNNAGSDITVGDNLIWDQAVALTSAANSNFSIFAAGTGQVKFAANAVTVLTIDDTYPQLNMAVAAVGGISPVPAGMVIKNTTTGDPACLTQLNIANSGDGTGDVRLYFAGGSDWLMGIDDSASDNRFALGPSSLGGNDALRITNATPPVITYNATHPTGTFDYVCEGCGQSSSEEFTCCGTVEWHDDVMDYRAMVLRQPGALEYMTKIGVMEQTCNNDGDPEIFAVLGRDVEFAWSMAWQNRQYAETLEHRITQLEAKVGG